MKSKKLILFLLLLVMFCSGVVYQISAAEDEEFIDDENADEVVNTDCDIIDFQYTVIPNLSSYVTIKLSWYTPSKMENLVIETYSQSTLSYVTSFSYEWMTEVEDEDGTIHMVLEDGHDVRFIEEPIISYAGNGIDDDGETIVIETIEYYHYEISYKLLTEELGTLKLQFKYSANEVNYKSIIYVPAGIHKKAIKEDNSSSNGIAAAITVSLATVIGTFLIILATSRKTIQDMEKEEYDE